MDVRAYKLAAPVAGSWPGSRVRIWHRPLAPAELQRAALSASTAPPSFRPVRHLAEILALAISPEVTADELLHLLDVEEMSQLAAQQEAAQRHATVEDYGALKQWIDRSVMDHPEVMHDAQLAAGCEGPAEFYGSRAISLTPAQVTYVTLLQGAFRRHYGGEEIVHIPAKRLREDRKERLAWQM